MRCVSVSIFSKSEYETMLMDFKFAETDDFPTIQAYGMVDGKMYYCNATYSIRTRYYAMWEDGRYSGIASALYKAAGRVKIEVILKRKKGELVDFKIDLERLAETVGNPDIKALELDGWGLYDHETEM